MGSGKTTPVTTTQTTKVDNPEADRYKALALPYAEQFAANAPKRADFSNVAGFDPLQTQGQEQVLGATGSQGNIVGAAGGGNQFLSSGAALDPNSNAALGRTIDASTRPIIDNLLQEVLPKIRGDAVTTGNFGSSRQGIAEGLATGRAAQAVGDTAAKVATTGYNSGLDAMVKAQGISPNVAQAQALPGTTTSAVGDVRQALAQALLGEKTANYNYDQQLPLLMAKELTGLAAGTPAAGTVSTNVGATPQANPLMQAAGLGTAAGGLMTGMSNLLPFILSDRRAKEDVVQIGELFDKTPIYLFRYKGSGGYQIGVMADEVKAEAVTEINGVKFVDLQKATEDAARIGGGL